MDTKIQYKFILFSNLVVWSMWSIVDLLEESGTVNVLFDLIMLFFCPVLVFIAFMEVQHTRVERTEYSLKQHAAFCLRFFGCSVIIAYVIAYAACHNIWIIRQSQNGRYDLFNGIEYVVYGIDFVLVSCIEFIIYGIVKGILKKRKEKHEV